jgi:SAM-dependent methyltransferase
VIDAGGYPETVLRRWATPLEQIPVPADSVDVIVSNAVIEHLYELRQAFAQLYRITRPGGFGLHQVDHRDHRDFSRPLEHLLLSEEEFEVAFARCHGECGNRYRPEEVDALFRDAMFEVIDFTGDVVGEPDYLKQFLPRLRRASRSRYRNRTAEELRIVSGFFRVRKPTIW